MSETPNTHPPRPDGRETVRHGNGVIVLRVENGYGFHEHGSIIDAKAEAHRLARNVGGKFVVYVPVAVIERTPPTTETPIAAWRGADDDDLPF